MFLNSIRSIRLASLYDLTSKGYTEIVKMFDFASDEQLPHIQKAIKFGRKAIEIRERVVAEKEGGKSASEAGMRRDGGGDDGFVQDNRPSMDDAPSPPDGSGEVVSSSTTRADGEWSPRTRRRAEPEKESSDVEIDDFNLEDRGKSSTSTTEDDVDLVYQRHLLGLSLMNLAFNLDSWDGTALTGTVFF